MVVLSGELSLVGRYGAICHYGYDDRTFVATDLSAGADKNFHVVVEIAAKDFLSQKPGAIAAANLFAEDFFLKMIFVADVEDAAFRSGDQARYDHALDEQVRQVGHDEAVLDGAGLAFVGVANDISHRIGLFADKIPLHAGGKSGAAHAF